MSGDGLCRLPAVLLEESEGTSIGVDTVSARSPVVMWRQVARQHRGGGDGSQDRGGVARSRSAPAGRARRRCGCLRQAGASGWRALAQHSGLQPRANECLARTVCRRQRSKAGPKVVDEIVNFGLTARVLDEDGDGFKLHRLGWFADCILSQLWHLMPSRACGRRNSYASDAPESR